MGHLLAHRQVFEEMAEGWGHSSGTLPSVLCRLDENTFRWGTDYVERTHGQFVLSRRGRRQSVATIETLATSLGTTAEVVDKWLELASANKVYCIEDAGLGTIQFLLEGSEWRPYGFRYALESSSDGMAWLEQEVKTGGIDNSDSYVRAITGRWFYFESAR